MQLKSATGLLLLALSGLSSTVLGRVIPSTDLDTGAVVPSVCRGYGSSCYQPWADTPAAGAVDKRTLPGRPGRGGSKDRGGGSGGDKDGGSNGGSQRGGGQRGDGQRGEGQRGGSGSSATFKGVLDPEPQGLNPGQRSAMEEFDRWDKSRTPDERGENNHWLFYTQLEKTDGKDDVMVQTFLNEFNRKDGQAKFRSDLGSPSGKDNTEITAMNKQYSSGYINDQVITGKAANWAVINTNWLIDGITSFAAARTAAQRGGDVRLILPTGKKVDADNSFFTNFEAYELTRPGSKVDRIIQYNGDSVESLSKEPIVIWKKGDAPIGKEANFDKGENFP
ncbi:hypothetical protein CMUS01_02360 [Colletotrichum musicola]|uniref:Uncharacterized protein n=1 Tax=Colletotrichum musicola TaxID=2175873 RepID=A0A8H6NV21_9PEZI|nr:hypothetical protein CMUS01_02360 [Colletotrichum musicola]